MIISTHISGRAGRLRNVRIRKTGSAIPLWLTLFLVLQPGSGLFAAAGSADASLQWLTVCTQQGVHQVQLPVSGSEQLPAAPEAIGWACPDCVPAPLGGPLFSGVGVLVMPLLSGSPEHAVSASLHLNFLARPALPARAPPAAVSLDS